MVPLSKCCSGIRMASSRPRLAPIKVSSRPPTVPNTPTTNSGGQSRFSRLMHTVISAQARMKPAISASPARLDALADFGNAQAREFLAQDQRRQGGGQGREHAEQQHRMAGAGAAGTQRDQGISARPIE